MPEDSRIVAGRASPNAKQPARKSGPIAQWHADGDGSDSVGKHDAFSLNGVGFDKGVFGQAFSFSGDGVSVNIPYSPDLDVGDEMTIEFWMKADPENDMRSLQGLVATEFYAVFIGGGGPLRIGLDAGLSTDGGATWATTAEVNGGGAIVSPGQWHHIAATYDGTKLQLYIDGQPSGRPIRHTGRISPMLPDNFISIGSEEGRTLEPEITHKRYFDGLIDEVAIYNRALSPEEIAAIYRTGKDAVNPQLNGHALLNISGGEIILILVLLFILGVVAVGFLVLIYVIVRAVADRPPTAPLPLPPEAAMPNQQRRDREHLKLLSIFHFVFAGLALVGIGFLCVHYAMMHTMFSNSEMWKSPQQAMPPKAFLDAFIWFYLFMGVMFLTGLVLNVLSGIFLWQKRHRVFSMIIGGLNCLQIPFGTALGVFTILVLSRDSVRELYSGRDAL